MRISWLSNRPTRTRTISAMIVIGLVVAACGASATSPEVTLPPPPTASPTPTPDPHLAEPAKADDVFRALVIDGLVIVPNTASSGGSGKDPVKSIQATYLGWPISISEYRTAKGLNAATKWKSGSKPGKGEAPMTFVGLNIIVEWGSKTGPAPHTPADYQVEGAVALRDALDKLLSPLRTRTIVKIPAPIAAPGQSAAPSPPATELPSASPSASS